MNLLSCVILYKCLLIVLVLLLLFIHNTKSSSNNRLLRFRNSFLRVYIAANNTTTKPKTINEYSKKIIEKIEKKYKDFAIFYNSLTDEEKEMIDFIISIIY